MQLLQSETFFTQISTYSTIRWALNRMILGLMLISNSVCADSVKLCIWHLFRKSFVSSLQLTLVLPKKKILNVFQFSLKLLRLHKLMFGARNIYVMQSCFDLFKSQYRTVHARPLQFSFLSMFIF